MIKGRSLTFVLIFLGYIGVAFLAFFPIDNPFIRLPAVIGIAILVGWSSLRAGSLDSLGKPVRFSQLVDGWYTKFDPQSTSSEIFEVQKGMTGKILKDSKLLVIDAPDNIRNINRECLFLKRTRTRRETEVTITE